MMKDRLEELLASDGGVTNEAFTEDGDSEFRGSFFDSFQGFDTNFWRFLYLIRRR